MCVCVGDEKVTTANTRTQSVHLPFYFNYIQVKHRHNIFPAHIWLPITHLPYLLHTHTHSSHLKSHTSSESHLTTCDQEQTASTGIWFTLPPPYSHRWLSLCLTVQKLARRHLINIRAPRTPTLYIILTLYTMKTPLNNYNYVTYSLSLPLWRSNQNTSTLAYRTAKVKDTTVLPAKDPPPPPGTLHHQHQRRRRSLMHSVTLLKVPTHRHTPTHVPFIYLRYSSSSSSATRLLRVVSHTFTR